MCLGVYNHLLCDAIAHTEFIYTPIPHRPESHELTRIDKYLDSWLNRTQFVKVLTDSHSP